MMKEAKLDSFSFPDLQCRSSTHNLRANCIGRAEPEKICRDEDGRATSVHYRCEYGHGWFLFVNPAYDFTGEELPSLETVSEDRII